ncbi:MAG TPA: DUF4350 domain-containing protein [Pyrinomonadaceae bacterium]|nr:DUF4350 domain-containing protein [Pyrinomonadaceae bacterium]
MRKKLGYIVTISLAVGGLIAINSAAYVSEQEEPDNEWAPNRSTYHAGPTGTRAVYDFLNESGYKVMRWRETPTRLLSSTVKVQTFVIVGRTRLDITETEALSLLEWVARGGRLVLVERRTELSLLPPSEQWTVTAEYTSFPGMDVDPASVADMTKDVEPLRPIQPSLLTQAVEQVMPSRFAGRISFAPKQEERREHVLREDDESEEEPPSVTASVEIVEGEGKSVSPAPVVHLSQAGGIVLLDYPHGAGRIIVLSDPYIFSNGGIALRDNLQLATNILASTEGLIAFDEYHQGRGTTQNPLFAYFAGTPVLAICAQIGLFLLLVLWTQSRRFGRPIPVPQIDRRSSLEFVASMAEVQQRARALDLAIENVYSRTRRVLARYAGIEYNSTRAEIAKGVAARSSLDAGRLERLMRQCEEVINGKPISERLAVHLVKSLREVEKSLGMRMRSRDVKQAAQNI